MASCTTHSSPSCRFFPVIALQGNIVHLCVLIESKPSRCGQEHQSISAERQGMRSQKREPIVQSKMKDMGLLLELHSHSYIPQLRSYSRKLKDLLPLNAAWRLARGWQNSSWAGAAVPAGMATNLFQKETGELISTIIHSETIGRIDDPNQCISLLKVVFPIRSEGLLASNVP